MTGLSGSLWKITLFPLSAISILERTLPSTKLIVKHFQRYVTISVRKWSELKSLKNFQTFGITFDGWECSGEHYLAVFAAWTKRSGSVVERLNPNPNFPIPSSAASAPLSVSSSSSSPAQQKRFEQDDSDGTY